MTPASPRRTHRPTRWSWRRAAGAAGLAIVATGAATGIGIAVGLDDQPGSIGLYLLSVLIVSYAAGLWAGLLAAGLSFVGLSYFFVDPQHGFTFDESTAISLAIFVIGSLLTVGVLARELHVKRALRETERRLELTLEETETGFWEWNPREDAFLWSPNLGPIFGRPRGTRPASFAEFMRFAHPDDTERIAEMERRARAGHVRGETEFRIVTPGGETRWISTEATIERDSQGAPIRILGLARDVTERKRRENADRFLADAGDLLNGSFALEETLRALAELAASRLSDWCAIELLESGPRPAFRALGHVDASEVALVEELRDRYPVDGAQPGPRLAALESGKSQLLAEIPDELLVASARDEQHLVLVRQLGLRSAVVAPIPGPRGPLGLLTLVDAASGRRFGVLEVGLAEELARRIGNLVLNAELHASERAAREAAEAAADRTARLQHVTAALAAATTPEEIAEALVSVGMSAFKGSAAWIGYVSEDGRSLLRMAQTGWPPPIADAFAAIPLDGSAGHLASIAVARTGRPVWAASADELEAAYPDGGAIYRTTGFGALGAVPIPVGGGTAGVVLVCRTQAEPFSAVDRAFLLALGSQTGQALERARAHAEETELRRGIERILEVSPQWLAGTREEVAQAICSSAVETFGAAACHLFDLEPDGLRLAWREPPLAHRPPGRLSPIGDFPGLEDALRELRPVFVSDVQGTGPNAVRGDARADAEAAGLRSSLRIPVSLAGTADRVLILSYEQVIEPLTPARMAVKQRYADQAALALEHAERAAAEREAAQSAERVQRLQSVTASLATAASVQEIARLVLEHVTDSFGGSAATIALVSESDRILEVIDAVGYPPEVVDRFRRFSVDAQLPLAEAFRTGEPTIVRTFAERDERFPESRGVQVPAEGPAVSVPLALGGRTIGAIGLRYARERDIADVDLALLESLARLAAQAIERARLYEREQTVAQTMQRGVLPDAVPRLESALVAARYVPGSTGLDVGGDWYDVIRLEDHHVVLAIGDVVGKGVVAASTMAQLRNALRAYALEGFGPSAIAGRMNRIAEIAGAHFATLFVASVDTRSGDLRYTSAGHPPALVVPDDGEPFALEGGGSLPLGVSTETVYDQELLSLEPGSTLILYTDGLVESRSADLSSELERLRAEARSGPVALELLVDHLLKSMLGPDRKDDVALLALRLLEEPAAGLALSVPAAYDSLVEIRTAVLAWLDVHRADPREAFEISLACWEACANAIEHATDTRRATIELTGEAVDGTVVLTIRDHGGWREPRPTPHRGLGLRLVTELSHECVVNPAVDGTRVTIVRHLTSDVTA